MTAKEKLLETAPSWTEAQAEIALRAVELADAGSLEEFRIRATAATLRRLDEREAAAGFSWDEAPAE